VKEIKLFPDQRYRTYEFDPSLVKKHAQNAVRNASFRTSPSAIFPAEDNEGYIFSSDPRVAKLKKWLRAEMDELVPAALDDDLFSTTGVSSNFSSLLTDTRPMGKAVLPMCSNDEARREMGLVSDFQDIDQLNIARELASVMLSDWEPGPIKIAKGSTSGFPFFVKDAELKKALLVKSMPDMEMILTLASKGNLEQLYRKTQGRVLFAYKHQTRISPDGWVYEDGKPVHPKERPVADLHYVLSDGASGTRAPAPRFDAESNGLALGRMRTVYGLANTVNLIQALFFEGHNVSIHNRFEQTFVHRGPADVTRKLAHFGDPHLVAVDTSNHDFLVPKFIMNVLFDELRTIWDDRVVDFIERAWTAPMYTMVGDPYGEPQNIWIGNPLDDADFERWYGVPSGTFLVTFAGKFGCLVSYLTMLQDIGVPVVGRVKEILEWRHPDVAIMDLGDDAVVLFADRKMELAYADYVEKGGNHIYSVGVEPKGFLGFPFVKDQVSGAVWAQYNPVSYQTKLLVPEQGLTSYLRQFWALGWEQRKSIYAGSRGVGIAMEALSKGFYDIMGFDLDRAVLQHNDAKRIPGVTNLDPSTLDVILDPSKLFYRYQDSDIDPKILSQYFTSVRPEEYFDLVSQYKLK
jgi:hypothetical protein